MGKNVYLIHGWTGSPEGGFRSWLKQQLETSGYNVTVPAMPDTDEPKRDVWVSYLQKIVTSLPEDTILVGHSMGGATVLRYLEALPEGQKIDKAVLVAGVIDRIKDLSEEEKAIAKPWLEVPIDIEKVRKSAKEIIAFFSDNDPWIPLESEKLMREELKAKTVIEHDMRHYGDDDGILEVPAVLKAILGELEI